MSPGWCQPAGDGAVSCLSWLRACSCPRTDSYLLVRGAEAQVVLGLGCAHWEWSWVHGLWLWSLGDCRSIQGCRGHALSPWWTRPCPGTALGKWGLKAVCLWWAGLCPFPASCSRRILVLGTTGCWAGVRVFPQG